MSNKWQYNLLLPELLPPGYIFIFSIKNFGESLGQFVYEKKNMQ